MTTLAPAGSPDWVGEGAVTDPRRPSRGLARLLVVFFVAIAVAAALAFIPLPYAVMSPGPITNTLGTLDGTPVIEVSGAQTYPTQGELAFTTVRVSGGPGSPITAYDLLAAWADSGASIVPEEQIFPPTSTREQIQQEGAAEMTNSQEVATAVAVRATGVDVPATVEVAQVVEGAPAAGRLLTGDVVLSVDGAPVTAPAVLRDAVQARAPGQSVEVVVRRDGTEQSVTVPIGERDGVPIIGILMAQRFAVPIDVTIHSGAVGGPSAGLMFSLAIYDVLTPGALVGDHVVAGTGAIASDGTVEPIGGIVQKLVGARAGGAGYFLAPTANCGEVVGQVPDGLQVIAVETFDQARAAVGKIAAGDTAALPTCTQTP